MTFFALGQFGRDINIFGAEKSPLCRLFLSGQKRGRTQCVLGGKDALLHEKDQADQNAHAFNEILPLYAFPYKAHHFLRPPLI
jgi:hypothetical protein